MIKKSLIQKTRNITFVFLLCLGALSVREISFAHALQPTFEGVSNMCRWQYVRHSDKDAKGETYVLRIFPLKGEKSGMLESWEAYMPPWRCREADDYRKKTTRIEIKGAGSKRPVHALTCKGMFYGFPKVKTADLSGLDTKLVHDMDRMFYKCEKLTSISGIDGFSTLSVDDMHEMFSHCYALRFLEVGTWMTDMVTKMDQLFFKCHALESLDLSEWNVSSVMSMEKMFAHCHSLTTIGDTGKWDVVRVATMADMFHGCSSLVELDMSDWVLPDCAITRGMFHKTEHLKSIRIGRRVRIKNNAEFSSAGSKTGPSTYWVQVGDGTASSPRGKVFTSCDALRRFHNDIGTRDDNNAEHYVKLKIVRGTSGSCVWEYLPCDERDHEGKETYFLRIQPLPGNDSGTLGHWNKTPPWHDREEYRTQTTKVEIARGTTLAQPVKACTCLNMFSFFRQVKDIDVSGLDVKNVTDMRKMFRGCCALTSLDLSAWNVSDSVKMKRMFEQTWFLKTICLGGSFCIKDDAKFCEAGSQINTHWAHVAGGTVENPGGEVFTSPKFLAHFHRTRMQGKTGSEQYTRITPNLVVTFDKHAHDATGIMDPQIFAYLEKKPFTKNAYERTGYEFTGWEDRQHVAYRDMQSFNNTTLGFNVEKILTAQWEPRACTITFSANVSAAETSVVVPDARVVKYGHDFRIPANVLVRDGYEFLRWTTKADGTGEHYYPGTEIKGVAGDIVLYAQWQKKIAAAREIPKQEDQKKDCDLPRTSVTHELTCPPQEPRPAPQKRSPVSGWHEHDGNVFYTKDGKKLIGWQVLSATIQDLLSPEKNWFYFDKDGVMLKGQHELVGGDNGGMNWFYFDEVTGAQLRNCWKEIRSQGKICYYGSDGAMYKGWHEVDGKRYHFDEVTGALTQRC